MDYDNTKIYGTIVNEMATEFNKGHDIYESAAVLPKYVNRHYVFSRYACKELYRFYPDNQKVVTHVLDTYVMNDNVATAFFVNIYADYDKEIEFMERSIGKAYSLLRQIQSILQAMAITAHPEDYTTEQVNFVMNSIIRPITAETKENEDNLNTALEGLKEEAEADQSVNSEKAEEAIEQEKNEMITEFVESTRHDAKPILYEIKDYQQCSSVFDYLQETNVLDDRTKQIVFLNAITQADMSKITPNLITKFRCAVARLKWAVKGDVDEWSRVACNSIGKTPSQALSGASNNAAWYEDLCKILPEYPIKK